MLKLIGQMAKNKYDDAKAKGVKMVQTKTPLKLHQGSAIEISPVAHALIAGSGGLMPEFDPTQSVISVGQFNLFGHSAFRSYLSDGKSFIQTVADKDNPEKATECRFYTSFAEVTPTNKEEWAFLLAEADGYIGYPFFDEGDYNNGGIRYMRLWSPGETRINPVKFEERVTEADGDVFRLVHKMMQYGRRLGDDAAAPSEYLITTAIQTEDGATFNRFLGIDLDATTLEVFGAAPVEK